MIVFSVMAVTTRKILRAATYLLFTLFAAAVVYFMLDYEFLGAVQIAVYAGGIVVLFVFAILLTSKPGDNTERPDLEITISWCDWRDSYPASRRLCSCKPMQRCFCLQARYGRPRHATSRRGTPWLRPRTVPVALRGRECAVARMYNRRRSRCPQTLILWK